MPLHQGTKYCSARRTCARPGRVIWSPVQYLFLNRNKQASKSLDSCCSQQTLLQTPQHCWGLCARRPEPSRSPGERAPMLFAFLIALNQEWSVGGTGEKTLLSWFFPFNSGLSAYLAVIWKNSEGWYLRALPYCCSLHSGTYFQCLANSPLTQLNAHPGKTECMGIYRKEM